MASETIDALVLSSLKTSQELLMKKKETIHQLDTQIIELIQDADTLEEVILDIEDTQDRILEKVNLIDTFIKLHSTLHPQSSLTASSSVSPVVPQPLSSIQSSGVVSSSPPVDPQSSTSISSESTTAVEPLPHAATTISSVTESTTVTTHTTTLIASSQLYNTSRLPKLELPTFSGDPLSWQSFWDSFDAAVNTNPTLSPIHKFNYRIAGNFRKVFIFGYFEEALLFENKFPRPRLFFENKFPQVKATVQLSAIRSCIPRVLAQY